MDNTERMQVEIVRRKRFIRMIVHKLTDYLVEAWIDHIEEEGMPGWSRSDAELESAMKAMLGERLK